MTECTARYLANNENSPRLNGTPAKAKIDLGKILTQSGRHMDRETFRAYVIEIVDHCGSGGKAADALNTNSGFFTQVIKYEQDSPTLRRILNIPKHPRRKRLCIEIDPARFDTLRANRSRAEFLAELLDAWQGEGKLRY